MSKRGRWVALAGVLAVVALVQLGRRTPPPITTGLAVVAVGPVPEPVLAAVERDSARCWAVAPRRLAPLPLPDLRAPGRGQQLDANAVLAWLARQGVPATERVLAVVAGDGTTAELNFVFGLAQCPGRFATVYLPRLAGRQPWVMEQRAVKVARHELGHTFGLRHCDTGVDCVMTFAASKGALDRTTTLFCPACRAQLGRARRAR